MDREELRAITAQGPSVILADRESLLRLMDALSEAEKEIARLRRRLTWSRLFAAGAAGLWVGLLIVNIGRT
jgi:hypothetical protein